MRKSVLVAGLLSVVVLLSGCIEQSTHVKINADGTADVTQTLLLSEELSAMAVAQGENVADGIMGDLTKEFTEENGYQAEAVEENNQQGVEVSKHFESIEDVFESELFVSEAVKEGTMESPWKVEVDKGFLVTHTSIKAEVNYEGLLTENAGMSEQEAAMMEQMGESFDFSYSITTPVQAKSQNADEVVNRTYTWNLGLDENKTIELEYHVLDVKNAAIVSVVGLISLIALIFLLKRARKDYLKKA